MKAQDKLIEIFYNHLKKNSHNNNIDEFTHNVVADYLFYLMNVGHIPAKACDILEADLNEEVIELYNKIQSSPAKNIILKNKQTPQARPRRIN